MPVYVPELQLLVTAAPGTGSTSMRSWALAQPGAHVVPEDPVSGIDSKHATVDRLTRSGWAPPISTARILTTTRNPFDFWVAEWHRTRTRWLAELPDPESWVHEVPDMARRIVDAVRLPFHTWLVHALRDDLDAGRTRHLNPGHIAEADIVCRMEAIDDDLWRALDVDVPSVPHENCTERPAPYWQQYDVAARRAVEVAHAPDLERFGYVF